MVDKTLLSLEDEALEEDRSGKPREESRWRLWQVETAFACNLHCIICPWTENRNTLSPEEGVMSQAVWEALFPHLTQVDQIDFSGGGEPLLNPHLAEWIHEAKQKSCKTGFLTNGTLLDEAACSRMLAAGVDWVAFSADGATAKTYEAVRKGAAFSTFYENVKCLASKRCGQVPWIMLNVVMMPENIHELDKIVALAAELGMDQVNFKQCDVVRGEKGRGLGLYDSKENKEIRAHKKKLKKARKLARKLEIKTTAFSFTPEEQAVCDQDPRNALFIGWDGAVAPCINLAMGGSTSFLGEEVEMPTVVYGRLPEENLLYIWASPTCRSHRERFEERVRAFDHTLAGAAFEPSPYKLKEKLKEAQSSMPKAPEGCTICHYLYGI